MAEGARLESVFTGNRNVGSNPTPSARSAFAASERTNFPREVAEMALAHTISSKVEQAYRRGDLFERRRLLMVAWATFCGAPRANTNAVVAGADVSS